MLANYDEQRINCEIKEKGFFSEYLPPAFSLNNTFDPYNFELTKNLDLVEPLRFNMSRFSEDGKRRLIYVPEFSSYISTVKYMIQEGLIKDLINESYDERSFSPLVRENGTLVRHENIYRFFLGSDINTDELGLEEQMSTYIPNIVDKIKRAKGAKGILYLDIANFYSSIYTHLLPSIKLGYEEAEAQFKAKRSGNKDAVSEDYLKYYELDQKIRDMNAARTNGILPGNIISQFLAESLLAQVDKELESEGLKFVRYVDDYEFFVYDESALPVIQNKVSSVMGKYFLSLNNEKTKYTKFPYYVVENLEKILSKYSEAKPDLTDMMNVFDTFFALEESGTKGAIRYLIKSINENFKVPDEELFETYLFNVLVNDSRSLIKVCQLLIERRKMLRFTNAELGLIKELIKKNNERNNHLEVVWLLYLWKQISNEWLSEKLLREVATSDNELAKIILIEEYEFEISRETTETKILDEIINSADSWLLLYQLYFHNYITKEQSKARSKISKNLSFYSKLKRNQFSFYHKVNYDNKYDLVQEDVFL